MTPVVVTKSLTAASANCISLSQSVAAGANAILNGGSIVVVGNGAFGANVTQAVLDTQRRVTIVSAGNDSANSARIYGLRGNGQPINEILALTNAGAAVSVLDYKNVSRVVFTSSTASTVTVGTSTVGSTDWVLTNYDIKTFNVQLTSQVVGNVTYSFEGTGDRWFFDPPTGTFATTPQPAVQPILANSTVAASTNITTPIVAWRQTVTAGTGTVTAQGVQAGISDR